MSRSAPYPSFQTSLYKYFAESFDVHVGLSGEHSSPWSNIRSSDALKGFTVRSFGEYKITHVGLSSECSLKYMLLFFGLRSNITTNLLSYLVP
uniref:Uncharacterized protein n=1 Tax=Arundo donax TaxID=35708 RepID=A0A0A8YUB1_ARUDO